MDEVFDVGLISIHAPREGSDVQTLFHRLVTLAFLSTLPARGATCLSKIIVSTIKFLSTLPARGATLEDSCKILHN